MKLSRSQRWNTRRRNTRRQKSTRKNRKNRKNRKTGKTRKHKTGRKRSIRKRRRQMKGGAMSAHMRDIQDEIEEERMQTYNAQKAEYKAKIRGARYALKLHIVKRLLGRSLGLETPIVKLLSKSKSPPESSPPESSPDRQITPTPRGDPFPDISPDSTTDLESLMTIRNMIGEGGNGRVFHVEIGGKDYALKVSREDDESDIETSECNERNVIQHKYLGEVFVLGDRGYASLMPFADGGDLIEYKQNGKPGILDILHCVLQIVNGMKCMLEHAPRFLYTDMKAANCLRFNDGTCVIADVGGFTKFGEDGVATYPPPETIGGEVPPGYIQLTSDLTESNIQNMASWFIGILLFELVVPNDGDSVVNLSLLSYENIEVICDDPGPGIDVHIKKSVTKIDNAGARKLVTSLLKNTPTVRIKFEDIESHLTAGLQAPPIVLQAA